MKRNKNLVWFGLLILAIIIAVFFNRNIQTSNQTTNSETPFTRTPSSIMYSRHAKCRMSCRHIDGSEIVEILRDGRYDATRTKNSSKGISYAIEGRTHDNQLVRLVVAPKPNNALLVVTVIDLEHEYPCNCN